VLPNNLGRSGILVIVIVGLAAATAAASRWTPWSPLNTCLFCGSAPRDVAVSLPTHGPDLAPMSTARELAHGVTSAAASDDGALPSVHVNARAAEHRDADASDEGHHDWQPWSDRSSSRGEGGESAAVFGGLARLSGGSIAGGGSTVHAAPATTATIVATPASEHPDPAPAAAAPAPASGNNPAPTPSASPTPAGPATTPTNTTAGTPQSFFPPLPPGNGGFSPNLSATTTAPANTPAPTATFNQQATPPPSPFVPPAPGGPLSGTDPPGTIVGSAVTPAATPEPASLMLIATGLAAAFGELRRRRVI